MCSKSHILALKVVTQGVKLKNNAREMKGVFVRVAEFDHHEVPNEESCGEAHMEMDEP
jgi:hypothetical protein